MLAYELWYNNKNKSNTPAPKIELPIKKIFYNNNKISIDKKTIEEYGGRETKNTKQLQDLLQAPLNTDNPDKINVPDYSTGSGSAKPYIIAHGELKIDKREESRITIFIGAYIKKNNYRKHILDFNSRKIITEYAGKIKLKIDKDKYLINSKLLFSAYVESGIINKEGVLNIKAYDNIITKFLKFVEKQKGQNSNLTKPGKIQFSVYILPDDSKIEYKNPKKENGELDHTFISYFGTEETRYADSPTQTAKFISFDDSAFTINCKQKKEFYKNICIGDSVLVKVYTDPSQTFTINRLKWTFINISNPDFKFEDVKKGILVQLYKNYDRLKRSGNKSQLKVICIQSNQAKQEILIDENLTMYKMEKLFSNMNEIPPLCLEDILIDKSGEKPIWNAYVYVVKNFLAGNKISKDYLLSFFSKILKQKRYNWLKLKNNLEQEGFFKRTEFCMKHLITIHSTTSQYMNKNEEFADRVGKITRTYIDFKQENNEIDNSLFDILTYAKYDRERLRFIVSRVGRGVHLSKISNEKKKETTRKINKLYPNEEISDSVGSKDYSYFFFKGYYSKETIE